jgi:hypothetical protein
LVLVGQETVQHQIMGEIQLLLVKLLMVEVVQDIVIQFRLHLVLPVDLVAVVGMFSQVLVVLGHPGKEIQDHQDLIVQNMVVEAVVPVEQDKEDLVEQEHLMFMHMDQQIQ